MSDIYWGWPVAAYLFLAGVSAGAATVSASILLRGGQIRHFLLARYGALIAPFPVILGTLALIVELGKPLHAYRLFMIINKSPMSIGTWLLTLFIMLSLVYACLFYPKGSEPCDRFRKWRRALAWPMVPLGIGVAVYTGVLLGAMPARPFWNSPIIALLFLLSSLSTGMAAMQVMAFFSNLGKGMLSDTIIESEYLLTASDLILIGFELLTIVLFLMYGQLTVGDVYTAVQVVITGALAVPFWGWIVVLGLLIPAGMELILVLPRLLYNKSFHLNRVVMLILPVLILIGGYMLRYIILIAGQITHPMGL